MTYLYSKFHECLWIAKKRFIANLLGICWVIGESKSKASYMLLSMNIMSTWNFEYDIKICMNMYKYQKLWVRFVSTDLSDLWCKPLFLRHYLTKKSLNFEHFFFQNLLHLVSLHNINWSLQPFSQDYWPSFSHHLCCVC